MRKGNFNRILFIRTDRFGDFLLNLPAIHALRENFPKSAITVMAHPYVSQLVINHPDIDEVIECDENIEFKGIICKIRFIRKIRNKKFDIVIISNPSKKFNIVTYLAGIPQRVGYDRKWGFLLTKKIKDEKSKGIKHEIEYNLDLVGTIGAKTDHKDIFLPVSDKDQTDIKEFVRGLGINSNSVLIAIHPWTSDITKKWPTERFIRVAENLSRMPNKRIAIIGGDKEIKDALNFCQSTNAEILNLCGKIDLRLLPAFLKNCSLLISNDSGPAHIASAVKTPVVAIFGKKTPAGSSTRWRPWGENHIILDKNDLAAITVDDVIKAAKGILEANEKVFNN